MKFLRTSEWGLPCAQPGDFAVFHVPTLEIGGDHQRQRIFSLVIVVLPSLLRVAAKLATFPHGGDRSVVLGPQCKVTEGGEWDAVGNREHQGFRQQPESARPLRRTLE